MTPFDPVPRILPPPTRPLVPGAGPRIRLRGGLFSDAALDQLSHLLDDCFRLPGTSIRFGIDGIIGLVPFAGDALAGLLSAFIVFAAWARGAPPALLLRMVVNVALDVIVGTIPVLGDAFDIAWKANRRNYRLLQRHIAEPGRHRWRDRGFLLLLVLLLAAVFAAPLIALGYLLSLITGRL